MSSLCWKYGIKKLRPVLETTDIFIINESGWKILREESKNNIEAPTDILGYGPSTVIITKGSKGCEIHDDKKSLEIAIPKILVKQFKIIDPTGAGDGFSAGLIKKLLEGKSLREAVDYAQVVAVITCSRIGASPSFPTLKEVEKIMEKEI